MEDKDMRKYQRKMERKMEQKKEDIRRSRKDMLKLLRAVAGSSCRWDELQSLANYLKPLLVDGI